MEKWQVRLGKFLFKWRSFTPIPCIIIALLLFHPYYPHFLSQFEPFLTLIGIIFTLFGELLRVWTHLYASEGTSGRESYLKAESLNKEGPYSLLRNPLYSGNFLIVGGILIIFSNIFAFIIGLGFLIFQYTFIVLAEEEYLKNKFGEEWINYSKSVPRFIPKIKGFKFLESKRKNTISKAVFKELDTIFNIITMLFITLLLKINYLKSMGTKYLTEAFLLYLPILLVYIILKTKKNKWYL
ncbi:MAG: isoprenylcysteine carboxylmethyltransferase family protein [Candidatus Omnitrophica bacterium]|nr:isoprenylcysteine carboxylmethyltransferase family protein [Candidatus Omnitrophota bacterium]